MHMWGVLYGGSIAHHRGADGAFSDADACATHPQCPVSSLLHRFGSCNVLALLEDAADAAVRMPTVSCHPDVPSLPDHWPLAPMIHPCCAVLCGCTALDPTTLAEKA